MLRRCCRSCRQNLYAGTPSLRVVEPCSGRIDSVCLTVAHLMSRRTRRVLLHFLVEPPRRVWEFLRVSGLRGGRRKIVAARCKTGSDRHSSEGRWPPRMQDGFHASSWVRRSTSDLRTLSDLSSSTLHHGRALAPPVPLRRCLLHPLGVAARPRAPRKRLGKAQGEL